MKIIRILLLNLVLLGLFSVAEAQVTLQSGCIFLSSEGPKTYQPYTGIIPFTNDAGTNVYRLVFAAGPPSIMMYIFRESGFWKHGIVATGAEVSISYAMTQISQSINPPCNGWWRRLSDGQMCQQEMTGTCDANFENSTYAELMPRYVQLAVMPTVAVEQIPNPRNGMMVYDAAINRVKVYSNGNWRTLSFQ
jgi:hypothetical protein